VSPGNGSNIDRVYKMNLFDYVKNLVERYHLNMINRYHGNEIYGSNNHDLITRGPEDAGSSRAFIPEFKNESYKLK